MLESLKYEKKKKVNNLAFKYKKYDDPKIALAALRIDIEDLLNKIAKKNKIVIQGYGIKILSDELYHAQLIENYEYSLILDIVGILNRAVHSKLNDYDIVSYNWVIDSGIKLVASLNKRLKTKY